MQLDPENPWPGLESFEENAQEFFYGREPEALSLLNHVRDAPITVLYGRSGLGKTSLLRAGLFPLLRNNNYLPVYVRFELAPGSAPPTQQLLHSVRNSIQADVPDAILPSDQETLWEYLHHSDFELWSAQNYQLTPVIVLDQFEELFTLGERVPDLVKAFRNDFGDLVENRIPAVLAARIDDDEAVAAKFQLRSRSYKLVISLREDFLPELEGWRELIPSLGRSRVRLHGLRNAEAIDAVYKPAAHLMTDALARQVVGIVAGENLRAGHPGQVVEAADESGDDIAPSEVEPALLSLFCRELNEERKRLGRKQFDQQLVADATRDILSNYYSSCVRDLPPGVARFIESELITEKGFRDSYVRDDAVPKFLTEDELDRLISSRLLRLEDRYGAQRIELTHDVLTPVVREHRDRRLAEEDKEALAARAEEAQEREKAAQERALAEQRAKIEAQNSAQTLRKQTRILQAVLALTVVFALAAVLGLLYGHRQGTKARNQLMDATASGLFADSQLMLAGLSPSGSHDVTLIQKLLAAHVIPSRHRDSKFELLTALNGERNLMKIIDLPVGVTGVGFSKDGTRVISAGAGGTAEDNAIRMWDAATGKSGGQPMHVHDGVSSVALSADGTRIVSGGTDKDTTIRLWDAATHEQIGQPMHGHSGAVKSVAISPDGSRIVSGSTDKTVRLWNAVTGQPIGQPMRHDDWVSSVAFSPDGTRIASGSDDRTIRLWDAVTGQPIPGQPMRHDDRVKGIAFSPDGTRIASGGTDKTIRLWDTATQQEINRKSAGDRVMSVAFSPDGNRIASGGAEKTIRLWDANNLQQIGELTGHEYPVTALGFSRDSRHLVSSEAGKDNGTIRVWDASSWQPMRGHLAPVWARFYDDGRRIGSGSLDRTVRWWDPATGRPIGSPLSFANSDVSVVLPIDEDRLMSFGTVDTVQLWDAHGMTPIGEPLRLHASPNRVPPVSDRAASRIAAELQPGVVQLWNGELQPIAQVRPAQPIATMTFSRDGRILATGSESGMIRLWDSSTGEAIGQPMQGLQSVVTKIAFSDDGRYIAAACSCEALRLWDTGTFQSVGEDMRLDSVPRAVAFSPDGTTVASGGDDGAIQFWDAGNQTELGAPFAGHEGVVNSLDFSPDGTKLLSAGDDYSLRMWPVPPHSLDDAREVLCSKITHNMSKPKWNKEVSPDIKYERGCPGLPESDWSE